MSELTVSGIREGLEGAGYCSNKTIDYAVYTALALGKPLLIEGAPGVGKTSLAKAFAAASGRRFIRVQMYDGLTEDRILYDYNYQKQLLCLEAVRPALKAQLEGLTAQEALQKVSGEINFYGRDFLIRRPVLEAVEPSDKRPVVILFDEIDKASEEVEYMLYEFTENYSISIPEYGTITAEEDMRPAVFLTSNGYRDLSGALRRRCAYLYIEQKTRQELIEILKVKAMVDQTLAEAVADVLLRAGDLPMYQHPSIAEGVDWARILKTNPEHTKEFVYGTLSMLIKDHRDAGALREAADDSMEGLVR